MPNHTTSVMHNLNTLLKYQDLYLEEFLKRGVFNPLDKFKSLAELKLQKTVINRELTNIALNIIKYNKQKKPPHQELRTLNQQKKKVILREMKLQQKIEDILLLLPNVTHKSHYIDLDDEHNKILKQCMKFKSTNTTSDYVEISKKFNLIDFKSSGANFGANNVIYTGKGAELIRGLISYCLAFNRQKQYHEIIVPTIIDNEDGVKTGKIPKFNHDLYFINNDHKTSLVNQRFLSPTSEVQLMTYYKNQILPADKIYKLTSFTNCFRREAGASGSKTRGNLRLHEFHKVEIVSIVSDYISSNIFFKMQSEISELIESLGLNYQIIQLAKKNLSFSTIMTNDFEIYFNGLKKFIEISSLSDCGSFQTRRLKIRHIDQDCPTKKKFFNSYNGSALAIDRLFSAFIEHYYQNDKIIIPKVLQKFISFSEINN